MENVKKHLDLLGMPVVDKVTGFSGVVVTVGFDLYGCIQAIVVPMVDANGDLKDSKWFDVVRLSVKTMDPVMKKPCFEWTDETIATGGKGPSEKPAIQNCKW